MVIVVVVVFVLLIVFGCTLLGYRNKAHAFQEKIREAKSKVRVAKSKYVKVMDNSTRTNQSATVEGSGFVNGASGGISGTYVTSVAMVERLESEYEKAQLYLNKLIGEWNTFIDKFPNMIYSSILKLKKENYIDEDNLNMSTTLSDTIDGDLV